MNLSRFALIALRRDWRSGELRLIGIAILIAVACLTSVAFFTDRVKRATESQASELLAADLVLVSSKKIDEIYIEQARKLNLRYSRNESFRSVALKDERLALAEVKAVDRRYPIRGRLRVADALFGAESATDKVPEPGAVWLDSRLLQSLQAQPGDNIGLGAATLRITKILTYEPDRGGDLFNIAPRLLMNRADLPASKLLLPGSRAQYRLLLGGEGEDLAQYQQAIKNIDNPHLRVDSIRDARPEIRTALERAEQFLGLAALVSVALAGLAIAMSAGRYAGRHYDHCAILRCLGLKQRQITRLYLLQLLMLALLFSLPGCALGYLAQEGLNRLLAGMITESLPRPSLFPVFTGLAAGLVAVLAFALPQLLRLARVPPLRVLRRDLAPLPLNNYVIYALGAGALLLLSPWQSGSFRLTLYTLAGLLLTALVLAGAARLMLCLLQYLQPGLRGAARHGLASLTRRASQSVAQIIGLGIGVTVMLLLTLIRIDLLEGWQDRLPPQTPNYFLINIQPDQVDDLRALLSGALGREIKLYPMIRGRLTHINERRLDPEVFADPRARRLAAREFNLSYADRLQADNALVSGRWWGAEAAHNHYFSVEEGIAETLGIKQGDSLRYSIGGQALTAEVLNLRRVEWDSFNVNFFVVANTEAMRGYPGAFISSFYLPAAERSLLIQLVRQFPSVTILDVDALLKQVRVIMEQVVRTVEFVFIFTLLTGGAVLFAALQTTHDQRAREAALMSALGARRKQILAGLTAEFACLGLLTGLLSALAASAIALLLAEFVFNIDAAINPIIWLIAPLGCCIIIVLAGLLGTRQALSSSPMTVLRRL